MNVYGFLNIKKCILERKASEKRNKENVCNYSCARNY